MSTEPKKKDDGEQVYMVDDPYEGLTDDGLTALAGYYAPIASDFFKRHVLPFVRAEVAQDRHHDSGSQPITLSLFAGLQGSLAEEKTAKLLIN